MARTETIESIRRRYRSRDVDLLLADFLGRPVSYVVAHGEDLVDQSPIDAAMQRRLAGEPLQYIRGKTEFFGREFYIDDRVLIPRPETEVVVETAIARIGRGARVVDIGTGSGCIAVTLALERPDLRVVATDASIAALAVARRNGAKNLVACDVLSAFVRDFDWIVSNPPYVSEAEVAQLAVEVRDYEPRSALTPGPVGTEAIERILEQAGRARVILEIGFGQAQLVRDLAFARHFDVDEVRNDLAGIPRVIVLSRHGWK
ncbi:MAG TPA: peptide chain release factor N(5)-glutamine methyltransferase [Thermoanaerobaculia bacterium]|nr:peptide chain release factor N(5)-glutamine methyltransferase [Thermoanaerobaculia bacterium]